MRIEQVGAGELPEVVEELAALLVDVVAGGNSVGFLAPLDLADAAVWWKGRAPALADGTTLLWTARDGAGRLTGTVQLARTPMPNGRHRGEIAKLMVHSGARRAGTGRALLATAEQAAVRAGLTLLVLDTETDSPAERLYERAGWTRAGVIPDYAADPSGVPRPTTYYYRRLTR